MSEKKNDTQTSKQSLQATADKHKVSLVELSMILLLIGLVFVFVFGMKQLKIDKEAEALAQQKFEAVIPVLQAAIDAAEEFKRNDDFGEYPFDFGQLNLFSTDSYKIESNESGEMYIDTEDFEIKYDIENYGFIVNSKAVYGKADIQVIYTLADRSYRVEDPAPERKPTIRDEWLPQD